MAIEFHNDYALDYFYFEASTFAYLWRSASNPNLGNTCCPKKQNKHAPSVKASGS